MNEFPIDKLGPYPILQFAAAVVILAGLAFAIYRGTRDRGLQSPPQHQPPSIPEQRYYFDGPMGEALKLLRDGRNLLNDIREHVEPLGEIGRNANRELNEIKDEIRSLKEIKTRRR